MWEHKLRKTLQVIQNRAARFVASCDWSVPLKEVFRQIGWMSVNQLVFYHTVLLVFKVKRNMSPCYLYNMFNSKYGYNTRRAGSGAIQMVERPKLELNKLSFKWRGSSLFNDLPSDIRQLSCETTFKLRVKAWIVNNVDFSWSTSRGIQYNL